MFNTYHKFVVNHIVDIFFQQKRQNYVLFLFPNTDGINLTVYFFHPFLGLLHDVT